jgi:hypothetical protein
VYRTIAVNEKGLRIGEDHPNAKLTDHEVELVREMHEEYKISYTKLADKFEVSKGAIAKICRYERRGQLAANFKKVGV